MNKSKSPVPRSSEEPSKVRIAVRVRPTLHTEAEEDFIQLVDDNTIKITRIGNSMRMKFCDILPKQADQGDVQKLVSESIKSFIKGHNNTIFAYGQTGAGKTYTIMGGLPENVASVSNERFHQVIRSNERGILPRAVQTVVSQLKQQLEEDQCRLYLSFYEIYNEKVLQSPISDIRPLQRERTERWAGYQGKQERRCSNSRAFSNSDSGRRHSLRVSYDRIAQPRYWLQPREL